MLEIVNAYKPNVIWSDGNWLATPEYWKAKEFLAWLYNDSPVKDIVVANDRWGKGATGHHGGYLTYNDRYDPGHLMARKWENCMTLDRRTWGYARDMRVCSLYAAGVAGERCTHCWRSGRAARKDHLLWRQSSGQCGPESPWNDPGGLRDKTEGVGRVCEY